MGYYKIDQSPRSLNVCRLGDRQESLGTNPPRYLLYQVARPLTGAGGAHPGSIRPSRWARPRRIAFFRVPSKVQPYLRLRPVAAHAAGDDPYGDPTHAWAAHVPCDDPSAVSIWEVDLYEGLSVKGGLVLTSMASPLFDSKAGSFSSGSD